VSIADALEWDQMKRLLEDDMPIAHMEEQVSQCLPDIVRRVDKWIDDVEGHLVELLRKGREVDNLGQDILDASIPVPGASSSPFENTTGNEKILLRADSLFESKHGGNQPPVVYDAAVLNGYPSMVYPYFTPGYERPLDVAKLKPHAGAQKAARKILAHVGKPDATFLEMKAPGYMYRCGRCHDRIIGQVNHFAIEQQTWESMQQRQSELKNKGITFRNVHDLTFVTDKPMIKLMTEDELAAEVHEPPNSEGMKMCKVCDKAGVVPDVQAKESKIIAHLADVHDISEPKSPEHYGPVIYTGYDDDYPVDDYEDPIYWAQHHHWSEDDDMYDDFCSRRTKAAKTEPDEKTDVALFSKHESALAAEVEDASEKLDSEFEDLKDANHEMEPAAPKRKRARASQVTNTVPRKKQVRGKQGRLEGLMKMPIDIFTEASQHTLTSQTALTII
ncbi:hypothetical protein FRC09_010142, partial [Ceratobasidium sp. 395]